jgi:mannose-6-phosphate isomerase-like protein (cupin superfamily)
VSPERRLAVVAALVFVVLGLAVLVLLGTARSLTEEVAPGGASVPELSMVRLDNARVLVLENHYAPGVESALHAHESPRVVYVLEGGTLQVRDEDGDSEELRLEAGMTVWRPAEVHVVRNTGSTRVRLLEVEVRSPDPAH